MWWYRKVIIHLLGGWLAATSPEVALADGGTVRQSGRYGNLQVTVFTSPTTLRVGLIDVSVLALDGTTGEPHPNARVWVQAAPRGQLGQAVTCQATRDAATNKLLIAASLDLSNSGWWDVLVCVEDGDERAEVGFEIEVQEPLPDWFLLSRWIAWPVAVVGLYAIHRLLVHRKHRDRI